MSGVGIGSFAAEHGDVELKPDDIVGFDQLWAAESGGARFDTMGCGTFRTMSGPLEDYVVAAVQRSLADRGVAPADVDRIVFATTDGCLALAGRDFVSSVLGRLGSARAVPVAVSFQQCCGSVSALSYAWSLFADPDVRHVVVVAFDRTATEAERVRSFALFGDAVATCVVTRDTAPGDLRLAAAAVRTDYEGLLGRDSMTSRQQVAQQALRAVLGPEGFAIGDVAAVFPTNLYVPLTSFSAAVAGIHRSKLHFTETLRTYGHCGNGDWLLNLMDYRDSAGLAAGVPYLALASAPGFFAAALMVGT